MMRREAPGVVSVWVLAAMLAAGWPRGAQGDPCSPIAISVDTAYADTTVTIWGCRGFGQVFLARDTLIQSISAWRPAQPALDGAPRYLFITETYESECCGTAPKAASVLLDAGPLVNQVGDGIHPVEYRWVFDPPFALPYRGKFFFDILAEYFASFEMLAANTDPYPDGDGWYTGPVWDCSEPGFGRGYLPHPDLVFEVRFCTTVTGVGDPHAPGVALGANVPNPFSGSTVIHFRLPEPARVTLRIYTVAGRAVRTLLDSTPREAGPHEVRWDGRGHDGRPLPSGVYLYRLTVDGQAVAARRALLLR